MRAVTYHPLHALAEGHWFKLICGASFQDLPAVRNLTLAYTLAGADCIDVSADPGVIAAALEALQSAKILGNEAKKRGFPFQELPLLMVSLNDGEDPHFRKAQFDPATCPADCWRPCEKVCPADAIIFPSENQPQISSGVIDQRCYGCGRCLPVCPNQLIFTRSYVSTPEAVLFPHRDDIAMQGLQTGIDAIEIHTQIGREKDFQRLWHTLQPGVNQLKLLAISCADGKDLIDYLHSLYKIISPLPCPLIWQTDGRPMSGDLGAGATRAAIKLSEKVLDAHLPGYVQLAGGTNAQTVSKLRALGLLNESRFTKWLSPNQTGGSHQENQSKFSPDSVAGVAYGSYARVLLSPILEKLEQMQTNQLREKETNMTGLTKLESSPELLWEAVTLASSLTSQLKG